MRSGRIPRGKGFGKRVQRHECSGGDNLQKKTVYTDRVIDGLGS